VSETPGTAQIEVRRAWKYAGEDEGVVHIELAAGGESLNVNLKAARNPRMFEFILKHATITTEQRPAKEPKNAE
jgi:hypothetical protein